MSFVLACLTASPCAVPLVSKTCVIAPLDLAFVDDGRHGRSAWHRSTTPSRPRSCRALQAFCLRFPPYHIVSRHVGGDDLQRGRVLQLVDRKLSCNKCAVGLCVDMGVDTPACAAERLDLDGLSCLNQFLGKGNDAVVDLLAR